MGRDTLKLNASFGLSHFGLANKLVMGHNLDRLTSFCTHVVDSQHVLVIPDTWKHPTFRVSPLTQHYGVRAYLGAPLIDKDGYCLGTIAFLSLEPQAISSIQTTWVQILARWCMAEYYANHTVTNPTSSPPEKAQIKAISVESYSPSDLNLDPLKTRLQMVNNLVEKCHNSMTTIMGIAGMLHREIYGPLTAKQKEYVDVINSSGQRILYHAQEMQNLTDYTDEDESQASRTSLNLENLVEKIIQNLESLAKEKNITLEFTIAGPMKLWWGNSSKINLILTYFIQGVLAVVSGSGSLSLHLRFLDKEIEFSLWFVSELVDNQKFLKSSLLNPIMPVKSNQTIASLSDIISQNLPLKVCQQLLREERGFLDLEEQETTGQRYLIRLPHS